MVGLSSHTLQFPCQRLSLNFIHCERCMKFTGLAHFMLTVFSRTSHLIREISTLWAVERMLQQKRHNIGAGFRFGVINVCLLKHGSPMRQHSNALASFARWQVIFIAEPRGNFNHTRFQPLGSSFSPGRANMLNQVAGQELHFAVAEPRHARVKAQRFIASGQWGPSCPKRIDQLERVAVHLFLTS